MRMHWECDGCEFRVRCSFRNGFGGEVRAGLMVNVWSKLRHRLDACKFLELLWPCIYTYIYVYTNTHTHTHTHACRKPHSLQETSPEQIGDLWQRPGSGSSRRCFKVLCGLDHGFELKTWGFWGFGCKAEGYKFGWIWFRV